MNNYDKQGQADLNRNMGLVEKEMSAEMQKMQAEYWNAYVKGISDNASLKVDVTNIIAINSDITCDFDKETDVAMAQAYSFGNSIVPWSNTWSGASQANWFRMYQTFINNINPTPAKDANPEMEKQLKKIHDKILGFNFSMGSLLKKAVTAYMQNYCLQPGETAYTCDMLIPGSPTMAEYINNYKKSAQYKQKMIYLEQEYSNNLSGLQDEHDKLAAEYYGAHYQMIREAKDAVNHVDPNNPNNLDELNTLSGQMNISNNHVKRIVPAFTISNLDDYKEWLEKTKQAAKSKKPPSIVVDFSVKSSNVQHNSSTYSQHCKSFFYSSDVNERRSAINIVDDKFTASFSYQDIFQVSLKPSNTWYFENMLSEFRDYYDHHTGSALSHKKLWGEGGLFNVGIVGLIIGYGGRVKVESSQWGKTNIQNSYSDSESIGFGPITICGKHNSQKFSANQVQSVHNGLDVQDTSGMAKIIAVITQRPNV